MAPRPNPARIAALEAGLRVYETGRPCSHGHLASRFVSTSQCVECVRLRGIALRDAARAARPPKPAKTATKLKLRPRSAQARAHRRAAGQKLFEYQPPTLPSRAMHALSDYSKTIQCARNSQYLDSLIGKIA